MEADYKKNDDLQLYDSVVEKLAIDHKSKTVQFNILKVVGRIDRNEGRNFTYKVKEGLLKFHGVVYANIPYVMEWNEWSEFYRSAVVPSSKLLESFKQRVNDNELKHIYIGIDNGNEYNELDIICKDYSIELKPKEYILHDDFDWL
ncbi:hypothetical protein NST74_17480 [Paenibacillus sp. FSL F4-0125]|uniref:hypothetical protein n=1 Tax=Paenibacillus sp. FSL F4-0125 TaxID=2954730 RepID=UPI0030F80E62